MATYGDVTTSFRGAGGAFWAAAGLLVRISAPTTRIDAIKKATVWRMTLHCRGRSVRMEVGQFGWKLSCTDNTIVSLSGLAHLRLMIRRPFHCLKRQQSCRQEFGVTQGWPARSCHR